MSTGREEQGNQAQACHASGFIPVKKITGQFRSIAQ